MKAIKIKSTLCLCLGVLVFEGIPITSRAAIITFGPATTISGDTDVSTNGTLERAFHFGATPPSLTLNGVTFNTFSNVDGAFTPPFTVGNTTVTLSDAISSIFSVSSVFISGNAPFSSLSASYRTMLGSGIYASGNPLYLTLNGLTVGTTYEFQVWANESRGGYGGRMENVSSGGAAVLLRYNTSTNTDGGVGQFTVGTFVANSTSQTITNDSIGGPPQLQAFQLRVISTGSVVPPDQASLGIGLYAGISITGTPGATYRIEYSSSLSSTNWITLTNHILPFSPFFYVDRDAVINHGQRFYRAVTVQ